jgi:hypothetical protein
MAVTAEVVVPGAETGRQASESSAQPPSILGERVPRSPAGRPPFSDTPASADRAVPAEGPRETPAYSCEARPSPLDPRAAVGQDTRRRCEGSARREDADQHRADDIWPWRDPRQPIWSPVLRLPGASRQSVELPSPLPVCQGVPPRFRKPPVSRVRAIRWSARRSGDPATGTFSTSRQAAIGRFASRRRQWQCWRAKG